MKISTKKLSDLIIAKRKEKKMTQMDVANLTHINRAMLSKIESMQYVPSIEQLESLMDILEFDYNDIYEDKKMRHIRTFYRRFIDYRQDLIRRMREYSRSRKQY